MENFDLSSNEKLAMQLTGMEGTGKHFVLNGEEAHKTLQREKAEKFNTVVDEMTDRFNKHNEALEQYASSLASNLNGLEIVPMGSYVLVKPFENNPFQKIETSSSGIITDLGGYAPEYKNQETGETEIAEQFTKVGTVIEVGHRCEFLKTGDIIFYNTVSSTIVPFYKMGFEVVSESRIIAVVNDCLTQRKEEFKHGNN